MAAEPATWGPDIEKSQEKKKGTKKGKKRGKKKVVQEEEDKGPDRSAAKRNRQTLRESEEAAQRRHLNAREKKEAELNADLEARATEIEVLSQKGKWLNQTRAAARRCMQERGLMVCRSCAAKGEQSNPGLAEELGIDFTGARIMDTKKRDAFIEWVAAANGLGGKVFPPAIVETYLCLRLQLRVRLLRPSFL